MVARIRVRHALPFWQRLRRHWRAWRGAGLGKTHEVHFVWIGKTRLKRVRFADAQTAREIAHGLEQLAGDGCFPTLLMAQGRQLWVDFVPGQAPRLNDPADRDRLVAFFVRLYARAPATASKPDALSARLALDLDFLTRCGVLATERANRLLALERTLRPDRVWAGADYTDPVGKNFVIRDDVAVGIDIEALSSNSPLGTGLAKAWLRWPFDPAPEVFGRLPADGPDLGQQWAWVRLCFLGDYFKQKVLQGKPGYIRLEAFDRLLAGSDSCGRSTRLW